MRNLYESLSTKDQAEVDHLEFEITIDEHERRVAEECRASPLQVIESDCFSFFSAVVVIANLVTMFLEVLHPDSVSLMALDQLYLMFYITELCVRYLHKRNKMLFGPLTEAWWNWLDLFVVVVAVIDQWLLPTLSDVGLIHMSQGSKALALVRVLRLLRLLRLLKVLRSFLSVDTAWVEKTGFHTFMMLVIALNAITMGLEADIDCPLVWGWLEQVILGIFVFELAVRLKENRMVGFFCSPDELVWNYLDAIIVAGGVLDQWMLPTVFFFMKLAGLSAPRSGALGQIMMMMRIARLLRILRLVRLIRSLPDLRTLVVGVFKAVQGITWVMVLTFVFVYLMSLISVKLIGRGLLFGGHVPDEIREVFPSVHQAMWAYFLCMTGEYGALEPLFDYSEWFKLTTAFYVIVSSWAILSVLTSVVCDKMSQAQVEIQEEENNDDLEKRLEEQNKVLEEYFSDIDRDGSGVVTEEEWRGYLKNNETVKQQLSDLVNVPPHEVPALFGLMCLSKKPNTNIEGMGKTDFLQGFMKLRDQVTEKSVMRLEKQIRKVEEVLQHSILTSERHAAAHSAVMEKVLRAVVSQLEQSPPKSVSNFVDQAPCVEVQETASVLSESSQNIDQQEMPAEEFSGSETAITTSAPLASPKLDDSVEQLEVTTTSTSKKEGEVELESTRQAQFEQSMEKALGLLGTLVKRLDDMDFAQNVGLSHRDNLPEVIKAIDVSVISTLDGIAKTFFDRLEMKVGDYCQNIDMSLREFNTVIRTRDLLHPDGGDPLHRSVTSIPCSNGALTPSPHISTQ